MRKTLIAAGLVALLASPSALAQDTEADGTAAGAAGGAVAGAVVGGPVGAIIGAVAGWVLGNAIDDPDERVRTYVIEQEVPSVEATGELEVGAILPEAVPLYMIPDYEYAFANVNGQRVLVVPENRQVVHIF